MLTSAENGLQRDDVRLHLPNSYDLKVNVFARPEVPIQGNAVRELASLRELADTVERILESEPTFFGNDDAKIHQVAVTPDFHKGAGVPIGTVLATRGFLVPQSIGNDVNCGMRVHLTDLTLEAL
jgi:tRNA-splicing ligase RtcB